MNRETKQFLEWLTQERNAIECKKSEESVQAHQELAKLDIEDRLFVSVLLNSKEIVRHLLNVGADPNTINSKGVTILQLALAFKRYEIANLLLEYGAQPSFIAKHPKTKF